jgi:hypothetical protein
MRGILRLTFAGVWFLGCTPYRPQPAAWHWDTVTGAEQAAPAGSPPRPPAARSADELNALMPSPSQRIIITAGSLSYPYKALGVVQIDTKGLSLHSRQQVDARLRLAAWRRWGLWVDAVIHVTYRNEPGGEIYVLGVAVHVSEPSLLRL